MKNGNSNNNVNTIVKVNHRIFYLSFLAIFLLGSYLRLHDLGKASLNLDEAQSIWQAAHSPQYIINYMVQNVHLPLYNLVLHYWMVFFGSGASTLRFLSAVAGIASIPAIYFLTKEVLGDRKRALFASLIVSISPFWIWYSKEIRMYALLTFLTILSYYFFLRILKQVHFIDVLLFTLVNIIGMYTHYFYGLVLLMEMIFFFLSWAVGWIKKYGQSGGKVLISMAISAALLILAYSPWILFFYNNHRNTFFEPALAKPSSFDLVLSVFNFTFGYQPVPVTSALIALWPVAVLIGFIFLTKRRNPMTPPIYFLVMGVFFPIALVYGISLTYKPIFLARYLIMVVPSLVILLTWILTEMRGKVREIFVGVFFIMLLLSLRNQSVNPDVPEKENYRDAINYVEQNATVRDIIVVSPPYTLYPIEYYYDGYSKLVSMPIWDRTQKQLPAITPDELKADSTSIQKGHYRIFLISTLNLAGGYDVQRYMDYHYAKLNSKTFSQFIKVEVYQAEYPPAPQGNSQAANNPTK